MGSSLPYLVACSEAFDRIYILTLSSKIYQIIIECKFQQAWELLSSLQLSSRSYSKPGKSFPLPKNVNASISGGARHTTQQFQSDLKSTASGQDQSFSKGDVQANGPSKSLNNCFSAHTYEVNDARQVSNGSHSTMSDTLHRETVHHTASKSEMQTSARNDPTSFSVDIDDDDILEVIHLVAYSMRLEHLLVVLLWL